MKYKYPVVPRESFTLRHSQSRRVFSLTFTSIYSSPAHSSPIQGQSFGPLFEDKRSSASQDSRVTHWFRSSFVGNAINQPPAPPPPPKGCSVSAERSVVVAGFLRRRLLTRITAASARERERERGASRRHRARPRTGWWPGFLETSLRVSTMARRSFNKTKGVFVSFRPS